MDALEEPELMPGLGIYLRSWRDLETERPPAEVPTAIPHSAIRRYALQLGYRGRDRDYFVRVIRRVDVLQLNKQIEQLKRDRAKLDADLQRSTKRAQNGVRQRNARG
jgi:hypothetical protein